MSSNRISIIKNFNLKILLLHIVGFFNYISGQKPFQCNECDQGFVHKQSFEAHKRRHQGIVLHCSLCSKPFVDEGYLKKHMNWHQNVQKARDKSK